MNKIDAIKEYCSDLLYSSEVNQVARKHLILSAGLIENDLTNEGCGDWFERDMIETARYINENVSSCTHQTLDDVHLLLLEIKENVH